MPFDPLLTEYEHARIQLKLASGLFGPQRAAFLAQTKRRSITTGRRAGKTYLASALLIESAFAHPGELSLYLAQSRKHAKRLAWRPTMDMLRRLGVRYRPVVSELMLELDNGSVIWLGGCDDKGYVEAYRGDKYSAVVIDEAGSVDFLDYLVEDIIEPALLDLNGALNLFGTPGLAPVGLFYETSTGRLPGWYTAHWNVIDNPHIPHAREYLDRLLKQKKWTKTHPTFQREWMGRWVEQGDMMVYRQPFVLEQPLARRRTVIGLDFGSSESKATTGIAVLVTDGVRMQVIQAEKMATPAPSDIAKVVRQYIQRYHPEVVVADPGALGAGYVRDLRAVYGLPLLEAEKREKRAFIEGLNGDLISHLLVAGPQAAVQDWLDETARLRWKDEKREKEDGANHACDAVLYAWRHLRRYLGDVEQPQLDALAREEKEMEEGMLHYGMDD